jgi:hypothetical protein
MDLLRNEKHTFCGIAAVETKTSFANVEEHMVCRATSAHIAAGSKLILPFEPKNLSGSSVLISTERISSKP